MARVAEKLGFTTMSLYRHVASKDELLQLMWNASALGAERLVIEGDDWRSRLRTWAIIQRDMLDRHPWITQMPMAAPPVAPNSLHFVERGLETLDETGLADADKLRIIGLLSSYTLSEARMATTPPARAAAQAARATATARQVRRFRSSPCCGNSSTSRPTRGCTASPGPRCGHRTPNATSSCSASTASWTAWRRSSTGPVRAGQAERMAR